jgi:1,4-dihydroxy-2-naphthoate octaprenyltransferase
VSGQAIENLDPQGFSVWLAAARPVTLTAAAAPVMVGLALADRTGCVNAMLGLMTLLAALLIQIGTNLANDYFDFVAGADTAARLGPLRVTQAGLVEPSTVRNAALGVLGLAALIGCYLVSVGGWPILSIGIVSLVAAIAYTAGPWPLAYHGLGDAFVFIFFGLAAVNGTVFLQTGTATSLSIAASIPIACLVTAILVVNNLRDVDTDGRAGKRTLAVQFGPGFARAEYGGLVAIAFLMTPVLAWLSGAMLLLPLAAAPLAFGEIRTICRRTGAELNQSLARTAALHLAYGLLLTLALIL